jgi:hypothetical protein
MRKRSHKVAGEYIGNITSIDQIPLLDETKPLFDRMKRIQQRNVLEKENYSLFTTLKTLDFQRNILRNTRKSK